MCQLESGLPSLLDAGNPTHNLAMGLSKIRGLNSPIVMTVLGLLLMIGLRDGPQSGTRHIVLHLTGPCYCICIFVCMCISVRVRVSLAMSASASFIAGYSLDPTCIFSLSLPSPHSLPPSPLFPKPVATNCSQSLTVIGLLVYSCSI